MRSTAYQTPTHGVALDRVRVRRQHQRQHQRPRPPSSTVDGQTTVAVARRAAVGINFERVRIRPQPTEVPIAWETRGGSATRIRARSMAGGRRGEHAVHLAGVAFKSERAPIQHLNSEETIVSEVRGVNATHNRVLLGPSMADSARGRSVLRNVEEESRHEIATRRPRATVGRTVKARPLVCVTRRSVRSRRCRPTRSRRVRTRRRLGTAAT